VQVGNDNFIRLSPAEVDIASDTDDTAPGTPTYASFRNLIHSNPRQEGSPVNATINRAGQVGTDRAYFDSYHVSYAYYEPATQNNIPDVFWTFLNQTGPVLVNNEYVTARLSDPYFYVTGYPISAAYWAKVTIEGKHDTAVLIQPYERRVLTYVPSAPEGWRVQMGNVGLHYIEWRYRYTLDGPSTSCEAPSGKTGELWFARPDVQQWMGCARYSAEVGMTIAQQTFEHGEMLDLIDGLSRKTIYVLFEDGTVQKYDDRFIAGEPVPGIEPPPGSYAPGGGFGKVWREVAGVQARLGWATTPERVGTYDRNSEPPIPTPVPTALPGVPTPPPAPPPPTAVPPSTRSFPAVRSFGSRSTGSNQVIYTGANLNKFYVIYDFGQRWVAFDDTFGRP
jgi:hypothetical protein